MLLESVLFSAIDSVNNSHMAYCKFLSANDSGETGGHQAGILISRKALPMLFNRPVEELNHIEKRQVKIKWQEDVITESTFTYYESKGELRLTSFGKGFPYLNKEDTGALFVFTEQDRDNYCGYFLYTEDDINGFLEAFNISPSETNDLIFRNRIAREYYTLQELEMVEYDTLLENITKGTDITFPDSFTMSKMARDIENKLYNHRAYAITMPDAKILSYTNQEYRLFRYIEFCVYNDKINTGFKDMDSFIEVANQVLNRRKSRAGKSLEHHMAAIFRDNHVRFEEQVRTEGNKKPDFIFPSGSDYHNPLFPEDNLVSLAAKTTCKDRWRQVINEADRLRDKNKYLLTLQQGISASQLKEMAAEKVVLVVPKPYISSYPKEFQSGILTIKQFIEYIKEIEK